MAFILRTMNTSGDADDEPHKAFSLVQASTIWRIMSLFGDNASTNANSTPLPSNVDVSLGDGTVMDADGNSAY